MDAALNIFSYVGWVLLAIMILVFIHELGHYLLAKLFGMRVEKFSIGFPPKVFGKTIGDTEYVLGLTPLGGYVKISGMVDESMDASYEESEPQHWEFRAKPVWQRILVIVAGVVFNMVLAAVVFISIKAVYGEIYIPNEGAMIVQDGSLAHEMGLRTGDRLLSVNGLPADETAGLRIVEAALLANPLRMTVVRSSATAVPVAGSADSLASPAPVAGAVGADTLAFEGPSDIVTRLNRAGGSFGAMFDPALVGQVSAESAAEQLGLRAGDRIVSIGGQPIANWRDISAILGESDGSPLTFGWERPDSSETVPPSATLAGRSPNGRIYEERIAPTLEGDRYLLGVNQYVRLRDYGFLEAIPAGIEETWVSTRAIFTSLKRVFTGQENFRENVGGPIMIAKITKDAADAGARFFWDIVAMLSITLAIINILPIPALDGGHLVFLIYEGITRREPSFRVRMVMQQIGMVILLAFMAFVIFNDILKL